MPVPSLLKRWKRFEAAMDPSAEAFDALTKRLGKTVRPWLKAEHQAQMNRHEDATLMDLYDTNVAKGMEIQC